MKFFNGVAFANVDGVAVEGSSFFGHMKDLTPVAIIIVVFYFLLLRPQQKKIKQQQLMLSALKKGDNVMLNSGIMAVIVDDSDQKILVLEIAQGVKVKARREAVAEVLLDQVKHHKADASDDTSKSGKKKAKSAAKE